jgi:hypothetical protein
MLKKALTAPFKIVKKAAGAVKSGGRDRPAPTRFPHGKTPDTPKKEE